MRGFRLFAAQGIAYVPFFPLGGFSPWRSAELDAVAASVNATPRQVALAWLLHRAPTMLLIPGTSSVDRLRENLQAAELQLTPDTLADRGDRRPHLPGSANAT